MHTWVKRFIVHGSGLNSHKYLMSLGLCIDGGRQGCFTHRVNKNQLIMSWSTLSNFDIF
jgi:hypothetical protein